MNGALRVPGVEGTVDIFRDELGIPHARAGSIHDAFFAQGFVHASDRLWQMCYDRKRAAGRIAEWLGPPALTLDVFVRRVDLDGSARADHDAFDDTTRGVLDAYAAGVNAFLKTTDDLPLELRLLGVEPEPWQPWHCGAVMKMRHVLMGNYDRKLWRAHLLRTLGPDVATAVGTADGREDLLIVPTGERRAWRARSDELEPGALATAGTSDGSNSWAVHGSRTASGLPLVAGDPHRTLEVPNVYYQNHIACPDFDAIGLSIPGMPGMFHFGHNSSVAWCITHAMADTQDLYAERFASDGRYEFRGEWLQPERRTERFGVRDAGDVEVEVVRTHHGPVLFGSPQDGNAIAMRWTATDGPNSTLRTILPMLQASSVDELEECMRFWVDPCNNFVMADTQGTIAFLHRGRVPVRPRANGWAPVPGWTGEHEWTGDVAFEDLPRMRNPDAGYIVTANNRVCADDFPHYLGMDYAPGYRALRVLDRLSSLDGATAGDMAAIHADRVSIASVLFADAVARIVEWDGVMEPDAPGATVYAALREQLAALLLERPPLAAVAARAFPDDPLPTPALYRLRVASPRLIELDDRSALDGVTWDEVIDEALERAVAWLRERLGDDPDEWRWERVHSRQSRHPLARLFPDAAEVLNPAPVSAGGDGETVHCTGWETGLGIQHGSVARYVFDLADWDRSGWIIPLGTSGHPDSPHYADQAQNWARVELRPMTYSWDRIEAGAEARQSLEPST